MYCSTDCGGGLLVPTPPPASPSPPAPSYAPGQYVCSNTCMSANDGMCMGDGNGPCPYGTDCADCGPLPVQPSPPPPLPPWNPSICHNNCEGSILGAQQTYASNGICEDGGYGSEFSLCDLGTDCKDCGRRNLDGSVRLNLDARPDPLRYSLPVTLSQTLNDPLSCSCHRPTRLAASRATE